MTPNEIQYTQHKFSSVQALLHTCQMNKVYPEPKRAMELLEELARLGQQLICHIETKNQELRYTQDELTHAQAGYEAASDKGF